MEIQDQESLWKEKEDRQIILGNNSILKQNLLHRNRLKWDLYKLNPNLKQNLPKVKLKENLVAPKPAQKKEDGVKVVEDLRERLHKELLDVLEAEQKKEVEREEKLKTANETDKAKLEKAFGIERAKASNRIVTMSEYCEL